MDWLRKIHKWCSLVVGIQFLIWLGSGLYFNVMDHTKAGGHQYREHHHYPVNIEKNRLLEPSELLGSAQKVVSLKLITLLGKPFYLLNHKKGLYRHFANQYSLFDAYSGEKIKFNKTLANQLAIASYNGPGEIISTSLIQGHIEDFPRQNNATWRVDFSDEINTSVYIESLTGRVVGHSNDDKRFADIFFMLHFMDYANLGSFNNLQIIVFAFITLWLSLTGLIWTIDLAFRGQFNLAIFAKSRSVRLFDRNQNSIGEVLIPTHRNLLYGLAEHQIILPSQCGGGGTCGKCRIMISPLAKVTSADQQQFSELEISQGFRLACQHFSHDVDHMTLIDVTDANRYHLTLISNRFLSHDIKELRFKVNNGKSFDFKAGAFMRFFIPEGVNNNVPNDIPEQFISFWKSAKVSTFNHPACTRSYSLAASHKSTDELVFTIKMLPAINENYLPGIGSNFMGNLSIGRTIEALGPFEDFHVLENSANTLVLVGAGSGMAPLKAIIDEQLHATSNKQRRIVFIYGARYESDLIYREEFIQLAKKHSNFTYLPTLSKPSEQWLGAKGYVQELLLSHFPNFGTIDTIEFYLCGPKEMMEESIALIKGKGVIDNHIRFDDFT